MVQIESPKKPALPALPKLLTEVIDEVLATPPEKKNVNRRAGPRLAILPRCISSQAYRDIVLAKEEAKRRIDEEKEKKRQEREEAKAKKAAEKAAEKEAKANKRKGKGPQPSKSSAKGNAVGVPARQRSKRTITQKATQEVWTSSSEEEDSDWSSSSSDEYYDGSTSRCSECDVRFKGAEKRMAIGCDTEYCRRWYHRSCVDIDLAGMTERQIQQVPFVCKYC